MRSASLLLRLCFAASTLAAPTSQIIQERDSTCPSLHVVVARGTCESSTWEKAMGSFHEVADWVTSKVPDSDSTGLVYPASGMTDCATPTYFVSEAAGVANLTAYLASYSLTCPKTMFALIGYSQGGQVVGDTLCGGSEEWFTANTPLVHAYRRKIIAAITFGDPAFVVDEPYNRGNNTAKNGIFPRTTTAACSRVQGKLRAYCNADDKFCASGDSLTVHDSYVSSNGAEGAAFIVEKWNATHHD